VIRIENVMKSYLTLRGRRVVFRDLSFEIPQGVNVGLIGRNGAGKSTLMRLLSAVDLPDVGKITTNARLSWPVGLTGGMQKNLTGRDNVKFVCRVHGVRKTAMQEKIRYVQEFAEIGEYFDQNVSTYSSGMRARLAFGMSMAFDFDYYLIDEVMAVGDASFKQKSRAAFRERLERSKVIIVTHNMKTIQRMCDFVVHLDRGEATLYEDVREGVAAYHAAAGLAEQAANEGAAERAEVDADAPAVESVGVEASSAVPGADAEPAPRPRRRASKRRARRAAGGGT